MAWLLCLAFGFIAAVVAVVLEHETRPQRIAFAVAMGTGGAMLGGLAARYIEVSTFVSSLGFAVAALMGSVVLLGVYRMSTAPWGGSDRAR